MTFMAAVDAVARAHDGTVWWSQMDLNAGYRCYQGLYCFSIIRSEGPEALVAIG